MKTFLNNALLIEQYLQEKLSTGDRLLFEARMIVNPALRKDLNYQKKVYSLIRDYHRQLLKADIEAIHTKLFNDARNLEFRHTIEQIFKAV